MLYRSGTSDWQPVRVDTTDREMVVVADDQTFSSPLVTYANGEHDPYTTLAAIAQAMQQNGLDLRGCANCQRFRFSGMARQMSGGKAGYCGLVGFRNSRGIVRMDHDCGEHLPAANWPDDLAALAQEQIELAAREPAPRRGAAFEGAMLGLAIGDALGFPAEFRRRAEILRAFGPHGINDFVAVDDPAWAPVPMVLGAKHPPGSYSDDTQMTLAVAESLVAVGRAEVDELMPVMAEKFVAWSRSPDNNRAPGNTCLTGCENLAQGAPWRTAGVADSKGCGSAMRVAPIGLVYWREPARLLEMARASSLLTHGHDAAVEGAAAAALLVALALEKKTPQAMYDALLAECAPRSSDFRACLEKLPQLLSTDPEIALSHRGLGEAWVAEEAVVSALYCFWRSPEDFPQTVLTAVNTDGDSDSIACIAGGISGAFNGRDAIPATWREKVENGSRIGQLARDLETLSMKPPR